MGNFFRPGFWDLLGTVLGFLGLLAGGTIAINFSPSSSVVLLAIAALTLAYVGGYSLRRYLTNRAFPFAQVEHDIVLRFKKTVGLPETVKARLERTSTFSPRAPNLQIFDRYQLVPDAPAQTSADALTAMNHSYVVRVQRGNAFNKRWHPISSVELKPRFRDFRQLRMEYHFHSPLKGFAKRFSVTEHMDLPNDFSAPLEFYEVEITEPSKRRVFKFVFETMVIDAARVKLIHGAKSNTPTDIDVIPSIGAANECSFSYELKDAPVGSRLRFEWDWAGC